MRITPSEQKRSQFQKLIAENVEGKGSLVFQALTVNATERLDHVAGRIVFSHQVIKLLCDLRREV